jgi:adenylate cyclase
MADLIAQGPQPNERWRRALRAGEPVVIGRTSGGWSVGWDDRISRRHARLRLVDGQQLEVQKLPAARNPIFFRGMRREQFTLGPGEHFVIGRTTFTLARRPEVAEEAAEPAGEVTQHAFAPGILGARGFQDAAARIDMLSRLPDLITSSVSDSELLVRVAGVLMQATPAAVAVAILRVGEAPAVALAEAAEPDDAPAAPVAVLHYDCRFPEADEPRPSGTLARRAAASGESLLHLWGAAAQPDAPGGEYTASENVDWAFAVPVRAEGTGGWVLYVTGRLGLRSREAWERSRREPPRSLQDEVKFAEIVAAMLGNLRKVRQLQQRQAGLARFFAPVVMHALAGRDAADVLRPREAEIAVLFCDLRGFSRRSEEEADRLMELLRRVSDALGIMTRSILQEDGVIGDFHGDAAMGFWGWPLSQDDAPARAARTGLDILAEFRQRRAEADGPLGGFRCGIGIACGRAVAGGIGTSDQVKVTAFGPVVNLASRLEGMTKAFAAEILVDEATARFIRARVPRSTARVRRLAKVRPAGMRTPLMVHQLLPPSGTPETPDDAAVSAYEAALEALLAGHWDRAFGLLHEVPPGDRVKDFLTVFIASHGRVAPDDWDGVIPLPSK